MKHKKAAKATMILCAIALSGNALMALNESKEIMELKQVKAGCYLLRTANYCTLRKDGDSCTTYSALAPECDAVYAHDTYDGGINPETKTPNAGGYNTTTDTNYGSSGNVDCPVGKALQCLPSSNYGTSFTWTVGTMTPSTAPGNCGAKWLSTKLANGYDCPTRPAGGR